MQPERESRFDAQWRTLLIICSSLPAMVPILVFVATQVEVTPLEDAAFGRMMLVIFGGFAVGTFALSFLLAKRLRPSNTRSATSGPAGAAAGAAPSAADAMMSYMTFVSIIVFACSEIPLLLGFVYYVMTGSWLVFAGFALLTVAGYVLHFPRKAVWRDRIELAEAAGDGQPPIVS